MRIFVGCDAAGCTTSPMQVDRAYSTGIGRPSNWWAIDFEGPLVLKTSLVICPDCAERLGLVKLADDVQLKVKKP